MSFIFLPPFFYILLVGIFVISILVFFSIIRKSKEETKQAVAQKEKKPEYNKKPDIPIIKEVIKEEPKKIETEDKTKPPLETPKPPESETPKPE